MLVLAQGLSGDCIPAAHFGVVILGSHGSGSLSELTQAASGRLRRSSRFSQLVAGLPHFLTYGLPHSLPECHQGALSWAAFLEASGLPSERE